MAISQSDEIWVVANFKETQLEYMQPGQHVDIEVDAYPNEAFTVTSKASRPEPVRGSAYFQPKTPREIS